jgi:dTDP-4-dehydrorhamnose 3,5-epimerase
MNFSSTILEGLNVIEPQVHEDERGYFMEVFHRDKFREAGFDLNFVQENISLSKRGVVRGLHFQWDKPLAKLIRIVRGSALVVAVDIRKSSPTLGKWFGLELSEENKKQLYVMPGFASGFSVISGEAAVNYNYTAVYNPAGESNILWKDPDIGIEGPLNTEPILSPRDAEAISFADWLKDPRSDLIQ